MATIITHVCVKKLISYVVDTELLPVFSIRMYWIPPKTNIRKREVTIEGSFRNTATAPLNAPQSIASANTTRNAASRDPVAFKIAIIRMP